MDLTGIISVVSSFVATFGGIIVSSKLTTYRIEQLEKKVEKHNSTIERVFRLEQHEAVVDEQIKVANHRIDDLENRKE